jgi:hypothetical protein
MEMSMAMRRWLWIPVMAPVMYALWWLVFSADRLFAWQYSDKFDPPTTADYVRAAVTFWGALLTPVGVGLTAAIVTFRRDRRAQWPIAESCIVAIPLLALLQGLLWPSSLNELWGLLLGAQFVLGGVAVMALQNLGACARDHYWGRLSLSLLVAFGAMLHLFWLYAFIIYIDT